VLQTTLAPRAITFTNETIETLLSYILRGIGLHLSTDADAVWATELPIFTIQANKPLSTPVTRLLDIAGGIVTWRTDPTSVDSPPSTEAILSVPTAFSLMPPAPVYTYGTTHPIASAEYATETQPSNVANVQGFNNDPTADIPSATAYDWTDLELHNVARRETILDRRYLDTNILAQIADAAIRQSQRRSRKAKITTDPHPGIELHDTVTVVDAIITLNDTYIVDAILTEYDTTKGLYSQTLTLGHDWR
jgi:hypothetical protein